MSMVKAQRSLPRRSDQHLRRPPATAQARALGVLVDTLLLLLLAGAAALPYLLDPSPDPVSALRSALITCGVFLVLRLLLLMFALTTPGMLFFGLRMVNAETGRAPILRALVHSVITFGFCVATLGIGCLLLLHSVARNRDLAGWHDHVSGVRFISDHDTTARAPMARNSSDRATVPYTVTASDTMNHHRPTTPAMPGTKTLGIGPAATPPETMIPAAHETPQNEPPVVEDDADPQFESDDLWNRPLSAASPVEEVFGNDALALTSPDASTLGQPEEMAYPTSAPTSESPLEPEPEPAFKPEPEPPPTPESEPVRPQVLIDSVPWSSVPMPVDEPTGTTNKVLSVIDPPEVTPQSSLSTQEPRRSTRSPSIQIRPDVVFGGAAAFFEPLESSALQPLSDDPSQAIPTEEDPFTDAFADIVYSEDRSTGDDFADETSIQFEGYSDFDALDPWADVAPLAGQMPDAETASTAENFVLGESALSAQDTRILLVPLDGAEDIELTSITIIGREPQNISEVANAELFALEDPDFSLSKTHALFIPTQTGLWVMDLHSTNGTRVTIEGHTKVVSDLEPAPLGSIVTIGRRAFRVSL